MPRSGQVAVMIMSGYNRSHEGRGGSALGKNGDEHLEG